MARTTFPRPRATWRLLGAVMLAVALLGGCDTPDSFHDSLAFGTGSLGFDLTGEATTFSLQQLNGGPVWFRLESEADIDGRFVRLYFNGIDNKDYQAPQAYGHIFVSSFAASYEGTYVVKAYYVRPLLDIGEEELIATKTFVLTP